MKAFPIRSQAVVGAAAVALGMLTMPLHAEGDADGYKLAQQHACTACHGVDKAIVGPAYRDVAAKYKGDKSAPEMLLKKVQAGGSGTWGAIPMPPQAHVPEADLKAIIHWVLAGAHTD